MVTFSCCLDENGSLVDCKELPIKLTVESAEVRASLREALHADYYQAVNAKKEILRALLKDRGFKIISLSEFEFEEPRERRTEDGFYFMDGVVGLMAVCENATIPLGEPA